MVVREWRSEGQYNFTEAIYGEDGDEDELLFSIRLYHYNTFSTKFGCITFDEGVYAYVDFLNMNKFCIDEFHQLVRELCYDEKTPGYFFFQKPNNSLDDGLLPLVTDTDIRCDMFPCITLEEKLINVYVTRYEFTPREIKPKKRKVKVHKENHGSCSKKVKNV